MSREPNDRPLAAPAVTTTGGRVEMRLEPSEADGAVRYAVRFFVADKAQLQGRFSRTSAGEIEFTPNGEAPLPWLVDFFKVFL